MFTSGSRLQSVARSSGPPTTDPFRANVVLALHLQGANGANSTASVVDTSPTPVSPTTVGGTTAFTTAVFQYGNSSLAVAGAINNGVTYASAARFNCGGAAKLFTIEGWFNPDVVTGGTQQTLWSFNGASNQNPYMMIIGATMYLRGSNAGNDLVASFAHGMAAGTWYHIAAVKTAAGWRVYINGVQKSTGSDTTSVVSENKSFSLGGGAVITSLAGKYQDIRLTADVARYTGTFIPTGPFPDA